MKFFMESKEKYDAVDFSPTAKLPLKDKIWNAAGTNVMCLLPFNVYGYFLLYFYTDVIGMRPALAGTIIMFARMFDTVTDLCIGFLIDKFNPKWGKYRSWALWSIIPQLIMFVAIFTVLPGASMKTQIIWCWITFGCYGAICCTLGYIPQNSQIINMTTNVEERASSASWKGIFENVSILFAASCFLPMVNFFSGGGQNTARGWMLAAVVITVIAQTPSLVSQRYTRKYELNYDGTYREHLLVQKEKAKVSILTQLKYLFTNRPFIVVVVGCIIMYIIQTIRNSMAVYLFEYYFQMPEMTSISLFFNCALAMLGAMLMPYTIKLFKDSNRAFVIMAFVHSIMYGIWYLLIKMGDVASVQQSMHFGPLFFLYSLCGLFQGIYYVFPLAMMPSVVDYGLWKNDRLQTGVMYSVYASFLTLGGAIGSFVNGLLLQSTGYVAGQTQTSEVLSAMLTAGVLVPVVLAVAHGVLQMFSGISDKKHEVWVAETEARTALEASEHKESV